MNNTPTLEIDEDTHDYITRIHPLNYEHIRDTLPHRLYIDENGGSFEIHVQSVESLYGEIRDRSSILVWITQSTQEKKHTYVHVIEPSGRISVADMQGGWLYEAGMDIDLFYMLLNPLAYHDGWFLSDVVEAKKNEAFDTHTAFGVRSEWSYTDTFHPDLQSAMARVRDMVERRL